MTDQGDTPDSAVIELEPDDMGFGSVQKSGLLYVGRKHAGKRVRWVIEDAPEEE